MTCIAAVEHEGRVFIAGDSAASGGGALNIRADTKVFETCGYAFGFTTSFRMGQLLRYSLSIRQPDSWDVDRFMATEFVNAVRQTLKGGGWATVKDGGEVGGRFLVGVGNRLYAVHSDYQIARTTYGFDSVGSGGDLALGSLWTTRDLDMGPEKRLYAALDAAAQFQGGVAPPVHVVSTLGPLPVQIAEVAS